MPSKVKSKKSFALQYFTEPLLRFPDYAERRMFGCLAVYLGQKNTMVLAESPDDDVWNGVLIPTFHEHHESLMEQCEGLAPHPVLKKWLYLPLKHPQFEEGIEGLVLAISRRDPRIGIPIGLEGAKKRRPRAWMNLGPKSKAALKRVGILRPEQLKRLGWKKVVMKVAADAKEYLNLNFAVAVQGAILGRDWRSFSVLEKAPMEEFLKKARGKLKEKSKVRGRPSSKKK
jgi:hypothetical protein